MIVQYILGVGIVVIIGRILIQFHQKKIRLYHLIAWLFFWGIALFIVLIPDITSHIARFVGVGRGADLVLYISIIALFYIVFKQFTKIAQLERNITDITSFLAKKEAYIPEDSKK